MEQKIYGITELNEHIKSILDGAPELAGIYVRGEISNFKVYNPGNCFFTLKDETGALKCVMYRNQAGRLRFQPQNGMKVIALGRVAVFPRDGIYQLYCDTLAPDGVGDLHMAFEQLKARLYREGLFDPAHKKPMPRFPQKIAVVTSDAGKVIHDMLRMIRRRWPMCKVILLPVRVQGPEAPAEIAGAIRYADRWHIGDLIITGRGGGSLEELWAFNDERVARAIYAVQLPVITAVGHEPDVTIADFVADLSAATPTHAATSAVPDQAELRAWLAGAQQALCRRERQTIQDLSQRLEGLARRRVLEDPLAFVQDKRMLTGHLQRHLAARGEVLLHRPKARLGRLAASLDAMSPLKVLARGYAMATDDTGTPLRTVQGRQAGDHVTVALADGQLGCRVETVMPAEGDRV